MNIVQEKLIDLDPEDFQNEESETADEINCKKLKCIMSLRQRLSELAEIKELLNNEKKENEHLGDQVNKLVKEICTTREYDKYISFVREVDNIIKLLISLSGRLARVENALLQNDHQSPERVPLIDKRRVLLDQHKEAKQLKEEIDAKQRRISDMLAKNFNQEQFADYEHYIKMKSALIVEQREYDDKINLGKEQIHFLIDSLPDHMISKLNDLTTDDDL